MNTALVSEVLHVVIAMLFVAGLVGRSASFKRAGEAVEIESVASLLRLSEWFERTLVIPAYVAVLITGLITAWVGDWPLLGAFMPGTPKWALVSLLLVLSPFVFIPTYLAPRRKQRALALADAESKRRVTNELGRALHDPGVLLLRRIEFLIFAVVTVLMVAKPF